MEILKVQNLCKTYGTGEAKVDALKNVSFSLEKGEFVAVVGESGSGKSTLLNCIGALDVPTSGTVTMDGNNLFSMKEEERTIFRRRNIGFIFQNYNLVPVLNVYENIIMPIQLDGRRPDEEYIDEILQLLGLAEKREHMPNTLSGGQQQRVAIARALVTEPAIICLDEPLSNLDAKLRNQMRAEIIKLRQRINTTFIYVTHDQTEAMTLGDRIVIMKDGFIQQIGTPQEVFDHPANLFVAGFIGTPQMNFFDAKLVKNSDGKYAVAIDGINVELAEDKQARLSAKNVPEQDVTLGVRPDHIMLCADGVKGTVDVSELMGSSVHLHISTHGHDVVVIVPTNGNAAHFPMGSEVNMIFGGNVAHVFDKTTGKNLEW